LLVMKKLGVDQIPSGEQPYQILVSCTDFPVGRVTKEELVDRLAEDSEEAIQEN
jgi:hypothetical protein